MTLGRIGVFESSIDEISRLSPSHSACFVQNATSKGKKLLKSKEKEKVTLFLKAKTKGSLLD